MTVLTNTAEGGTDTTAVTTGNSGGASGDPWNVVQLGDGSSAITFSTEQARDGSLSYKYVPATSQNCNLQWDHTQDALAALRFYVYLTAAPSGTTTVFAFILTPTSGTIAWVRITSGLNVVISDSTQTIVYTSTATLSLNTWHRIECKVDRPGGTVDVRFFAGNDSTLLEEANLSAISLGGGNPGRVRFGRGTSGASDAFYVDDLAWQEATASYIGPASSGQSGNLAQVTETVVANAMTATKSKTIAQAEETNTAQTFGADLQPQLTAVYVDDYSRVRLEATVGGDAAITQVTFDRSVDLIHWEVVRGGTLVPATVDGVKLDDYEFTADVENTYRATYYDVDDVQVGQETVPITPLLDSVWLKSVARPFLNLRLPKCSVAEGAISRRGRGGVFDVIGRTAPVAVSDVRSGIAYTLRGVTLTFDEATALDYMLISGDILFVQAPASSRVPTIHAFCGDSTRELKGSTSIGETAMWLMPMTEVAKPGAFIIGVLVTYRTVLNRYASYADVLSAHATYTSLLDLVADPSEVVIP